jgi:hypothetical protein
MATNEEAIAKVNETNSTLVKVSNETDALLREIKTLEDALAAAGGAGGTITPGWRRHCGGEHSGSLD